MVCPYEVFMELAIAEDALSDRLKAKLFEIMNALMEAHVEFDIVDDGELLAAKAEDGCVRSGFGKFDSLVIPYVEGMEQRYLDKFKLLEDAGLKVFINPSVCDIIANGCIWTEMQGIGGGSISDVYVRRIEEEGRNIAFFFNNSRHGVDFRLRALAGIALSTIPIPRKAVVLLWTGKDGRRPPLADIPIYCWSSPMGGLRSPPRGDIHAALTRRRRRHANGTMRRPLKGWSPPCIIGRWK